MHQKIHELIGELQTLGYHDFQIKQIIRDMIGSSDLNRLSAAEQRELVSGLEEYVRFAVKCKTVQRAR